MGEEVKNRHHHHHQDFTDQLNVRDCNIMFSLIVLYFLYPLFGELVGFILI